jgi:ABC-type sugar transport system substrate-binding protein
MEETMRILSLVTMAAALAFASSAFGQNAQKTNRPQGYYGTQSRTPVATQPSNNPFSNPIGQGVPPAASANPNLNSNRTNVPR